MQLVTHDFFKQHLGDTLPSISLLDIGVSGGIDQRWRVFGDKLYALGVDPLIAEINRLSEAEKNSNIGYLAAYIVWRKWSDQFPLDQRQLSCNGSFERTSAYHAMMSSQVDYIKENYNSNEAVSYSELELEIDELGGFLPVSRVDFVKTDTDGFDYPALRGAESLLSSDQVLGLAVECNFHSESHQHANNFANIDHFLRAKGFTLFKLEPYNYSRAAFPARFVYNITAQTKTGSLQWADAYYFRDFCNPRFEDITGWQPDREKLIRMAMLLELFNQPDSVVELLQRYKSNIELGDSAVELLNAMVQRYSPAELGRTYAELLENFTADHTKFFPT